MWSFVLQHLLTHIMRIKVQQFSLSKAVKPRLVSSCVSCLSPAQNSKQARAWLFDPLFSSLGNYTIELIIIRPLAGGHKSVDYNYSNRWAGTAQQQPSFTGCDHWPCKLLIWLDWHSCFSPRRLWTCAVSRSLSTTLFGGILYFSCGLTLQL